MNLNEKIKKLAAGYTAEITSLRRELHSHPELSFSEHKTTLLLKQKLKKLKIDKVSQITETGVTALFKNGSGKCVALRADIDALPITEKTGLSYSSKNPGVMHACGHDAHTAMLYGAALILNELKHEFKGSVKFIFQPAEEKNPGGASLMIKKGVLKNPSVNAIFGQHILPGKPAGMVGFYPGVVMASQDELYITIKGKSGHGAKPHTTVDPIVLASQFILALQTIVSRNTDPYDPIVITIGKFSGGTVNNVIPAEVKLAGTIRTLNSSLRKKSLKLIERTLKGICSSAGGSYKFEISPGYPELVNSEKETMFAGKAAAEFFGKKGVFKGERYMFAEDFSYYLKKVPGSFYWIGAGSTTGLHTETLNLDEKTLPSGAGFLAYLAVKYLNQNRY